MSDSLPEVVAEADAAVPEAAEVAPEYDPAAPAPLDVPRTATCHPEPWYPTVVTPPGTSEITGNYEPSPWAGDF